jgi:hypothetical protein
MPWGFMRIPTVSGNPGRLAPADVEDQLRRAIERVRELGLAPEAELRHLYYSVGSETAVAVIKDLDDYTAVKIVSGAVRATRYEKFVEKAAAEQAFDESNALRGETSTR